MTLEHATAARRADAPAPASNAAVLDAGLATARATPGLTCIALTVPVCSPAAVVAAGDARLAWSARGLAIVGIGIVRELRGRGDGRWHDVITGARSIAERGLRVVGDDDPAARALCRPRLLGGLAFASGAADRAPWAEFGDAWFALPRWTYASDGTTARLLLVCDGLEATEPARWSGELAILERAFATRFAPRALPAIRAIDHGDRAAFCAEVAAITRAIASGECAKIVAARSAVVELASAARPADLLAALDARAAGGGVRLLVRPSAADDALIAATPERLVARHGDAVQCDALAGTIARSAFAPEATLLASDKDRREHALVVDAITRALTGAGAEVDAPGEPRLRELRDVLHLYTPISARLRAPRHVLELAEALHPTPAVGGTPTHTAVEWIAAHEPARGWYASPVGWFDLDGDGELAVAIRCGVFAGARARLWAGGGIVAGSDPERELAETEVKLRALIGAFAPIGEGSA